MSVKIVRRERVWVSLKISCILFSTPELLRTNQLDNNELISARLSEVKHADTGNFKTPESPSNLSLLPSNSTAHHSPISPTNANVNVLNLDEVVKSDLHLCSYDSLESNTTNSEFHKTVKNNLHSLQGFIPDNFLPEYRNPCWYAKRQYLSMSKSKGSMLTFSERERDDADRRFSTVTKSDHMYCLPYFFLAGFPKCATTALYSLITQHPQITEAVSKENHFWRFFFEQPGHARLKGIQIQWYLAHFTPLVQSYQQKGKPGTKASNESHQQITVDASPSTIWRYVKEVKTDSEICLIPATVKRTLPEAKFIVVMRDPVERLFSDYWYTCDQNNKWKGVKDPVSQYRHNAKQIFHNTTVHAIETYRECINGGSSRFECVRRVAVAKSKVCYPLQLGAGMYYYHIVSWLNVFPRERFLFLKMEELISVPNAEIRKVWAFLDLQDDVHINTRKQRTNENSWIRSPKYKSSFEMFPETRELLSAFYQPHNQLLAQLLSDSKYLWK